ncbi:hypothetical protein H5T87_08165 [bacterium]|nr:hypothetical protein [bacterium]
MISLFVNLKVNAQPKILKWDPDDPANCDTTFTYSLSSAQKKNCQVTIDIYSTEGQLVYETTISQLCPGNYSFTWDGTAAGMPGGIAPLGLYTFDITVNGKTPNGLVLDYDKDRMRSDIVKVQQTFMDVDYENPGKFKFSYVLESVDGGPASEANVTVYAPALENFQKKLTLTGGKTTIPSGSTPADADWHFVSFSQDIFQAGGALELPSADRFYAVVSGKDACPINRAHLRKPFLEAIR